MPESEHSVECCPVCGARIRRTLTAKNRMVMWVDADPDPTGNQAVYRDVTGTLRSRGLTTERPVPEHSEWQAKPHIASCRGTAPARPPRRTSRPGRRRAPVPYWRRP